METERILLRHWQESDAEALFKYASDPDVGPRAGWPARLLHQREAFRKHLGRPFYRQSCIGKSHGEMRFLRHRNAEQMQPTRGWGQGNGQGV